MTALRSPRKLYFARAPWRVWVEEEEKLNVQGQCALLGLHERIHFVNR
jgi:hypothetical protein